MIDALFAELMASVAEADEFLKGTRSPSRQQLVSSVKAPTAHPLSETIPTVSARHAE